jgi:ketosteroid isomerase-like protein
MSKAPRDPVAEEFALRDLVARYADAVTRQDTRAVAELFTADGEWIVTGHGEPRGHDEIAAFLDGLLGNWNGIVHALLSGRVHLDPADPDRATGRWYISEFGEVSGGDEVFFAGVYHDVYVRDEGLWRFARRQYNSLFRRTGADVATTPFPEVAFP